MLVAEEADQMPPLPWVEHRHPHRLRDPASRNPSCPRVGGKKQRRDREEDRDVSERVALGQAAQPTGGDQVLRAPMPGAVVEIVVSEGDSIEPGAHLMTIESMKLETAITASHAARVTEICVAPGGNFDQGDVLVRLAGEDGDEGGSK